MSGTTNIPGVCMVVRDGSKVLMVLRQHTGWKDGEYGLVGGHVEDNETFRQAACREVMEEVGLQVAETDLRYLLTVHRKSVDSIRVDVYFEITKWQGEPTNMEPERHGEVSWHDITDLPDNIVDYMRAGLQSISQADSYAEFGWTA